MKDIDLAYAAGFLDGEGTIMIHLNYSVEKAAGFHNPSHGLRVAISNTHQGVIDWLRATFGGTVTADGKKVREMRQARGYRPAWKWNIYSSNAAHFLELVSPYLRVKGDEAIIGLAFQRLVEKQATVRQKLPIEKRRLTAKNLQDREGLRQQLNSLRSSARARAKRWPHRYGPDGSLPGPLATHPER